MSTWFGFSCRCKKITPNVFHCNQQFHKKWVVWDSNFGLLYNLWNDFTKHKLSQDIHREIEEGDGSSVDGEFDQEDEFEISATNLNFR